MSDLDPHVPETDSLVIVGTNNPYERYIRAATPLTFPEQMQDGEEEELEGELGNQASFQLECA